MSVTVLNRAKNRKMPWCQGLSTELPFFKLTLGSANYNPSVGGCRRLSAVVAGYGCRRFLPCRGLSQFVGVSCSLSAFVAVCCGLLRFIAVWRRLLPVVSESTEVMVGMVGMVGSHLKTQRRFPSSAEVELKNKLGVIFGISLP